MKTLTTGIARVLFALPFGIFGIFHFANARAMAPMVPVPGGIFWVYFTGAALIAGSAGLITNTYGKWAAYGLATLLLVFIVTIHLPALGKPEMRQFATMNLLKDLGLLGGALTWAGLLGGAKSSEGIGAPRHAPQH